MKSTNDECSSHGRAADPKKVELIRSWKLPNNLPELKSFVCVLVYLREYIHNFAEKALPLRQYLKGKGGKPFSDFATDELSHKAIDVLKDSLLQNATIGFLDYAAAADYKKTGRIVHVYVDASKYGESSCIAQA